MDIKKIEQPKSGWNRDILKNFNFNFESSCVQKYCSIILFLLNKYLPYFYIVLWSIENEEFLNKDIFIMHDFIMNLKRSSRKNQFDKNILDYLIHSYTDINNYIEIEYNMERKILAKKQSYEEQEKKKEEYKKYKQDLEIKKQKQRERNKQQQIEEENTPTYYKKSGIYQLYSVDENNLNEKMLYIGMTNRCFKTRWQEHKDIVLGNAEVPEGMSKLYNLLKEEIKTKIIKAKPMIIFNDLYTNKELTQSDKESMELALINIYQPPGNTSGIDKPYYYSH